VKLSIEIYEIHGDREQRNAISPNRERHHSSNRRGSGWRAAKFRAVNSIAISGNEVRGGNLLLSQDYDARHKEWVLLGKTQKKRTNFTKFIIIALGKDGLHSCNSPLLYRRK
jgi:hypothetical protein